MNDLMITVFDSKFYEYIVNAENKQNQIFSKTYQSKEIQSIAKVSKTKLINWTQQGVILPLDDARGRGKVRIYNFQNLIEAMICRELSMLSIGVSSIKAWLEWLREVKHNFSFFFYFEAYRNLMLTHELSEELERLKVKKPANWENEYEHLNEEYEYKKKINKIEDPPIITRSHTIWEYINLYPPSLLQFCLVIGFNQDNNINVSILGTEDIGDIIGAKISLVVNLQKLISEAHKTYEK